MGKARVGVDIGGTFTDFVIWEGARLRLHKQPSTPTAPEQAILQGIDRLQLPKHLDLLHGTTVGTNTVLEGKGARTAFLTTAGFRDLLFLGRQTRRDLYSLCPAPTPTLAERALCAEIPERVSAEGDILQPLSLDTLPRLIRQWKRRGVQSVAVCLLFAYAYPEHERILRDALEPHFEVSLSSEVAPEFREYERASTTFLNAYLAPRMRTYLINLQTNASQADRVLVAHSNGGLMDIGQACRHPVSTLLSGPAAGVMGAWAVGRQANHHRLLTLDMGGTSTDVALIDLEPARTGTGEIGGMPLRLPRLDIHTVGAGGGSLAYLDIAGTLRVGPQSAGAAPGPAAYGKGDQPTVTDAHLILGHLNPECFGFGQVQLQPECSWHALERLGRQLGRSPQEVAGAILEQADAQMAKALRTVSVARGYDPARFSLLVFGGAGALHVCRLARLIGATQWIVPLYPGVLSAYGLLWSDTLHEAVRTVLIPVANLQVERLREQVRSMQQETEHALHEVGAQSKEAMVSLYTDLRYEGQSYELTVPLELSSMARAVQAFHEAHQQRYGYSITDQPAELVNLRMRTTVLQPKPVGLLPPDLTLNIPHSEVEIYLSGEMQRVPVFARSSLESEQPVPSPCLIYQPDTTLLIESGWQVQVDGQSNLIGRAF
jgi:N-methylhydantoinase A